MTILEKLDNEIKTALKAREEARLATVRLIKSQVKNKEIELIHPLSEAEFLAVLSTMVKQRRESIDQFSKAGRTDLVVKEEIELKVIESFLPQQLTDAEVDAFIAQAVAESKAAGPKDMGPVMKLLKDKTAGRVDGRVLSDKVKAKLAVI
ncbi:MAG TPA: glutamyl-tRNA amidotransferase [Deltaproteobacteria bacterium]|nr:MAG: glutamyl-tRNA amidotransferase [Deltaproteobacteria bacterium GWA2_45_12]HBF12527.1 glutamyl-tRNA amidotransferase [Deltaproteobacteria bacterium]